MLARQRVSHYKCATGCLHEAAACNSIRAHQCLDVLDPDHIMGAIFYSATHVISIL